MISKISQVNSLQDLAKFIVERYELEALTNYSQAQVHRKYGELTSCDFDPLIASTESTLTSSDIKFAGFTILVDEEAKKNNIQSDEPFSKKVVVPAFVAIGSEKAINDHLKKNNLSYSPFEVFAILNQEKVFDKMDDRIELQYAEDYLSLTCSTLDKAPSLTSYINESSNEIRGIIQNLAVIRLVPTNLPLCPKLKEKDVKTLRTLLGTDSDEVNILSKYIENRDALLLRVGNPITNENKSLILEDLIELKEWADLVGIKMIVNPGGEQITGASSLDDVIRLIKKDKVNRINVHSFPYSDVVRITTFTH